MGSRRCRGFPEAVFVAHWSRGTPETKVLQNLLLGRTWGNAGLGMPSGIAGFGLPVDPVGRCGLPVDPVAVGLRRSIRSPVSGSRSSP